MTTTVYITRPFSSHSFGDVITVDKDRAARLVRYGYAEYASAADADGVKQGDVAALGAGSTVGGSAIARVVDTVAAADLPEIYATRHGLACDGATDDTAALNALLAEIQAGGVGAHIKFPGIARINGRIVFPNDGAAVPSQVPIRFSGGVTDQPGRTRTADYSQGGLDLRVAERSDTGCATTAGSAIVTDPSAIADDLGAWVLHDNLPDLATVVDVEVGVGYTLSRAAINTGSALTFRVGAPKLITLGTGTLEFDHFALMDGGVSALPFGLSTNTTIKMSECRVNGNPTKSGTACDQDIFVLGGVVDRLVLTSALTSGVAYTSLAIKPAPTLLPSGVDVIVGTGTNTQTVTTSGAIAAGDTALPVASFVANANYPVRTALSTRYMGQTGSRLSGFQGYGSMFEGNHFERVRRLLAQSIATSIHVQHNKWWQTCGSNLAKAPSTLTTALTSGVAYTTLAVTALSQAYKAGDIVQVGVGAGAGARYHKVTVAADTAAGATSLPVDSFTADATYPVGTKVYNTSRGLGAALEVHGFGGASAMSVAFNRFQLNAGYNYATISGADSSRGVIVFNEIQDNFHANVIAGHRFVATADWNLIIPSTYTENAHPLVDDAAAVSGGGLPQTVFNTLAGRKVQLKELWLDDMTVANPLGVGARAQSPAGTQFYSQVLPGSEERFTLRSVPVGGATQTQLELTRGHIVSVGSTPSLAILISGTGSIAGTDTAGTITVNIGAAPAAGEQFQVSWSKNFLATPRGVLFTPANAAAAALNAYTSTQTTASARMGTTTAPAPSTQYKWNYIVIA